MNRAASTIGGSSMNDHLSSAFASGTASDWGSTYTKSSWMSRFTGVQHRSHEDDDDEEWNEDGLTMWDSSVIIKLQRFIATHVVEVNDISLRNGVRCSLRQTGLISAIVTIQLISFAFTDQLEFHWFWIDGFQDVLLALSTWPGNELNGFFASIALVLVLLASCTWVAILAQNKNTWDAPVRLWKVVATLMSTVFFIPIMNSFAHMLLGCSYGDPHDYYSDLVCWQGVHILYACICMILMPILFGISVAFTATYYEASIKKIDQCITARAHGRVDMIRTLTMGLLPICAAIFRNDTWIFILLMVLSALTINYSLLSMLPYHSLVTSRIYSVQGAVYLWSCLCMLFDEILHKQMVDNSGGILAFYFGLAPAVLLSIIVLDYRLNYLAKTPISKLDMYAADCKCRLVLLNRVSYMIQQRETLSQSDDHMTGEDYEDTLDKNIREDYEAVESWYSRAIDINPDSAFLHLQLAIFFRDFMENRPLNFRELNRAEKTSPQWDDFTRLVHYLRQAEAENASTQNAEVLKFQEIRKKQEIAQRQSKVAAQSLYVFWNNLSRQNPSVAKLVASGSKGRSALVDAKEAYEAVVEMNPDSAGAIRELSGFCELFLGDVQQAKSLRLRAEAIETNKRREEIKSSAFMNFLGRQETALNIFDEANGVVGITLETGKQGTITSVNAAICRMFGYPNPSSLMGEKIDKLLPHPLDKLHDQFLTNFLKRGSKSTVLDQTRMVLGQNKNGSLIPLSLYVRWADQKTQLMVGVIKPIATRELVMLVDPEADFTITSATSQAMNELSINHGQLSEKRVQLRDLIPKLRADSAEDDIEQILEDAYSIDGVEVDVCLWKDRLASQFQMRNSVANASRAAAGFSSDSDQKYNSTSRPDNNGDDGFDVDDIDATTALLADGRRVSGDASVTAVANVMDVDYEDEEDTFPGVLSLQEVTLIDTKMVMVRISLVRNQTELYPGMLPEYEIDELETDALGSLPSFNNSNKSKNRKKRRKYHRKNRGRAGSTADSFASSGSHSYETVRNHRLLLKIFNEENERAGKSLNVIKYSFMVCVSLVFLSAIALYVLAFIEVDDYQARMKDIFEAGERRALAQQMANNIQTMYLVNSGLLPNSDYAIAKDSLEANTNLLEALDQDLYQNGHFSSQHETFFKWPSIVCDTMLSTGQIVQVTFNLKEMSEQFISSARLVLASLQSEIIETNPDSFFIYENGRESVTEAYLKSVDLFIDNVQVLVELTAEITIIVSMCVVGICVIICIIVLPRQMKHVEEAKDQAIALFMNIPIRLTSHLKHEFKNYLRGSNKTDLDAEHLQASLSDSDSERSSETSSHHGRRGSLKRKNSLSQTEEGKGNDAETVNRRLKEDKRYLFKMVAKYLFFLCLVLSYNIWNYYSALEIVEIGEHDATLIKFSTERTMAAAQSHFYTREYLFKAGNADDLDLALSASKDLQDFEHGLLFSSSTLNIHGSGFHQGQSLMRENICPYIYSYQKESQRNDCNTVFRKILTTGLHPTLTIYHDLNLDLLRDEYGGVLNSTSNKEYSYAYEGDREIYEMAHGYIDHALLVSSINYHKDIEDVIDQWLLLHIEVLVAYCLFLVLLQLSVYNRIVAELKLEVVKTRSIIFIMPPDVIKRVKSIQDFLLSHE